MMEKHHKFSIWYVLIGIWVVLLLQNYIASMYKVEVIPYSQFLNYLKEGNVQEIAISENQIQGKMKVGGEDKTFKTVRVDPDLSKGDSCDLVSPPFRHKRYGKPLPADHQRDTGCHRVPG